MNWKSIQSKFVFWAGISLVLVAVVVIVLASVMLRNNAIENAKNSTMANANRQASQVSTEIGDAFDIARTLASALAAVKTQNVDLTREQVSGMFHETILRNPHLKGAWTVWEPGAFDNLDSEFANMPHYDDRGRFVVYWNRDDEGNVSREAVIADYSDAIVTNWYVVPKNTLHETIIEPYLYVVQGQETLLTSLAVPVIIDEQFYGVVGVDFGLAQLQEFVDNADDAFGATGDITLISHTGMVIAANGHSDWVGQSLSNYHPNWEEEIAYIQTRQETLVENGTNISVYAPVTIGRTDTPWSVSINLPYEVITAEATQVTMQLITVGIASILIGLVVLWFVARQVAHPIKAITSTAQAIVNGDLNREVHVFTQDETGLLANAFNQMVSRLREILHDEQTQREHLQKTVEEYATHMNLIGQGNLKERLVIEANESNSHDPLIMLGHHVNEMSDNLQNAIFQLQQGSLKLNSSGSQIQSAMTQQTAAVIEQDATIAQTVTTVEEIRSVVAQTAERAQSVAKASQQSVEISRQGQQAVLATIEGMTLIRKRVENIAETILQLSEHTQQIGEIINKVNEIADQSKLLALNASIEAARAGEEGRGFAVVAMEVRQLAEQSRDATVSIRGILGQIQQATNTAVMVTEEGSKGTESGMALVHQAGLAIQNLSDVIEQASQAATQIAASTYQQTNGMEQLAVAMMQIKQVSLQTTSSIRQTEQNIRELMSTAGSMEKLAGVYQL